MKKLLLIQYDLHQRLYNNVLDGFTDEETNQRLNGNKSINHVKYLAGHLLNSQYGLGKLSGVDIKIKWDDLFAVMGASAAADNIEYPTIEEIKGEWNNIYQKTRIGLDALRDDDLDRKPPAPFDQVSESVGSLWAFISHHQAYHIGQIAILRKAFGKGPMSYE